MLLSEYIVALLPQTHRRLVNLKQIISLVLVFFSIGSISKAQDTPLITNQQVLLDAITELAKNSAPESVKSSAIAVYLPDATDQSLEALRNRLFESGFNISRDYSNTNQFRVIVESNNELIRNGKSTYMRKITGSVTLSIYDSSDLLTWSDSATIEFIDEINRSSISQLTTDWTLSNFDTIEHRRSDRKILRWIQPVIITGAVATTVALLFSVRSQ